MLVRSWRLSYKIYFYNKNVLEYGLLLVGSGRFMIFHIEGRSKKQGKRRSPPVRVKSCLLITFDLRPQMTLAQKPKVHFLVNNNNAKYLWLFNSYFLNTRLNNAKANKPGTSCQLGLILQFFTVILSFKTTTVVYIQQPKSI